MKVFAYYRVSTDLQEDSWEAQQKACRDYAREHDIEIKDEYIEKQSAFEKRPVFDTMLENLYKVEGILVFDLDRLVRDPFQFAKLLNVLQSLNKKIFQVIGEIDPDKEEDVLLARIKTDIAEYESAKIKRRTRAGIARYIEKHGHWGRPQKKISKSQFEKYVEDGELIFPKTVIAKLFNVSRQTLRIWMIENGYTNLIKEQPEHLKKLDETKELI